MGRVGIEPTTLRLRVRRAALKRVAASRNVLRRGALRCDELRRNAAFGGDPVRALFAQNAQLTVHGAGSRSLPVALGGAPKDNTRMISGGLQHGAAAVCGAGAPERSPSGLLFGKETDIPIGCRDSQAVHVPCRARLVRPKEAGVTPRYLAVRGGKRTRLTGGRDKANAASSITVSATGSPRWTACRGSHQLPLRLRRRVPRRRSLPFRMFGRAGAPETAAASARRCHRAVQGRAELCWAVTAPLARGSRRAGSWSLYRTRESTRRRAGHGGARRSLPSGRPGGHVVWRRQGRSPLEPSEPLARYIPQV